jgi:Effector-associated domain 1
VSEFKDLRDALVSAFPTVPRLSGMLKAQTDRDLDSIITPIGIGLVQIVEAVIGAATAEGWRPRLIRGAQQEEPDNPALKQYLATYPAQDPVAGGPAADPSGATLLTAGVFLQRDEFRKLVKRIGVGTNPRVMVVRGPRGRGKTHSKTYIDYVLATVPAPAPAQRQDYLYLDLDGFPVTPKVLVQRIGNWLKLGPVPPQTDEQDARWVNGTYVDWLKTGLRQPASAATLWWLILDGFRVQTHSAATYDLIGQLAEEAQSAASNLRLVLLNYPDALPPQVARVLKEDIPDNPVTREHIVAFVKWLYEQKGITNAGNDAEEDVTELLNQVTEELQKRPDEKDQWLPLVHRGLMQVIERLEA